MPERTTQNAQTLLSPRIPRDTEHERYHPELEEELKVVARDLLPPEIIEGSMLHYEWMQYTLI